MPQEEFIIATCLLIDELYQKIVTTKLRSRGFATALSDIEIITIQVVGEALSLNDDKKIWRYFKENLQSWFQKPSPYPNFCKHCANLWHLHRQMAALPAARYGQDDGYIIDGFPLPVCKPARAKRHRSFKGDAQYGYCAAKDEHYYGFKGHLLINPVGMIVNLRLAGANVDEREMLPEMCEGLRGLLLGDKGYIGTFRREGMKKQLVNLQTPLRGNMKDKRSKKALRRLMRERRRIETVIEQLVERFKITATKTRDLWHLSHRVIRKGLAHSICVVLCLLSGYPPLQFEALFP